MTINSRAILLAVVAGLACGAAHASTLNGPFPESQPPDTFGACAGCTQLAYTSQSGSNLSSTLHLMSDAAVYSDPSNTFCAGCLDFVYQVISSGTSTDNVGRVTVTNFTGFEVDAGYSTAGEPAAGGTAFATGTWAPGLVDRNTADSVGFQFSNVATAIPPGGASTVLVVETNATSFTGGFISISDGTAAAFTAFEPTSSSSSPSPEPATLLLAGLGIAGLAGIRRFRKRT